MEQFEKAVRFALRAHRGQKRKRDSSPYIIHPLEVATIAATMTDDDDVLSAAVLHDTVEDTAVTAEDILRSFGKRVAYLVAMETENKRESERPEDTWLIRKEESLQELRESGDRGAKIVWLSDKLANMRSFARIKRAEGGNIWKSFHNSDPEKQKWYYTSVLELTEELRDFPAWQEYKNLLNEVF